MGHLFGDAPSTTIFLQKLIGISTSAPVTLLGAASEYILVTVGLSQLFCQQAQPAPNCFFNNKDTFSGATQPYLELAASGE